MPGDTILTIGADGLFHRGPAVVVPVGVNYWPGSCGVEMWTQWPEAELQRDLDCVRGLGLNCVRFFLRWQDFEPTAGSYDDTAFRRLTRFLGWCRERELLAQPSLFVGGMSGGLFWPEWKQNRGLFSDPVMRERSVAFAARVAQTLAPFAPSLAGVDFGNELDGLQDSKQATLGDIRGWCQDVSRAVRQACPGALLVSGVSGGPFTGDCGWRFEDDLGTDFHSVHMYPVPYWMGMRFDGLRDPFTQSFMPYWVKAARVFGPVMVQEFGTLITGGREPQDAYLRAVLPAAWNAGANGFLWWCLRDIRSRAPNYLRCGMESTLGLVDDAGRLKPGIEFFAEFAKLLTTHAVPDARPTAALNLYWPKHYYPKEDAGQTGNEPRVVNNRLFAAHYLLTRLGVVVGVVAGGRPIPATARTIVITGAHLDAAEVSALIPWVEAGGRLIWHGPRWSEWGIDAARLLGARPADFRVGKASVVNTFGQRWEFPIHVHQENCRLELAPAGAVALATDADGLPVLWHHRLGAGQVVFALPIVEEAVLAQQPDPAARDRWDGWYKGVLALVEEN